MRRDETHRKIVAALRHLGGPTARWRALRAFVAVRRRPDAVAAVLLGVGVLAMVLHWG